MINFAIAAALMDGELREDVHRDLAPCTEEAFLEEYAKRHEAKFGETWELAKENPCY